MESDHPFQQPSSKFKIKKIYLVFAAGIVLLLALFAVWYLFFQKTVSAKSEIPGVTMTVADEKKLIEVLKTYNFFDSNRVQLYGVAKKVTVNHVDFYLVTQPQPESQPTSNGSVFTSIGQSYNEATKTLRINYQVSKDYYTNRPENILSSLITARFISYVYSITAQPPPFGVEGLERIKKVAGKVAKDLPLFLINK